MNNYLALENHWKKIEVLKATESLLSWDMETVMPEGSVYLRQEQLSLITQLCHQWTNDKAFKDAILGDKIKAENERQARNLEIWKKTIIKNAAVDDNFVKEKAMASVECNMKWRSAKANSNYSEVLDSFKRVLDFEREYRARQQKDTELSKLYPGFSAYELAFDQYERGFPLVEMEKLLKNLCDKTSKRLPEILEKAKGQKSDLKIDAKMINKDFCKNLMSSFGFNFKEGRLDESTHPFCGGAVSDVRITTRVGEHDPVGDLFSTLHELGHALYEQGLDIKTAFQPSGQSASMGVHESQSRFLENFIGRSRPFSKWLSKKLDVNSDKLYQSLNPVKLSYIRVDSDEVTYNFHVLLRFELERDLVNGKLEAKDLPKVWNEKLYALTKLNVEKDSQGCLQDTHWYSGSLGYFPTYSLGNMLAAEIHKDFVNENPDWAAKVENGDFAFIREFMAQKVYKHGSLYDSAQTMNKIIGRNVSEDALIGYFDTKFLAK
jgi:carboxypeptidase Taq